MCEICSKLTIKTPVHHYSCLIKENSCPKNSIRMHKQNIKFYKRIKITKHLSRRKYLYLLWHAFRFIIVFSIFISAYRLVSQESITKKWIAKKRKYVTHDDTQANSKHAVTYRTPDIKKLNLVNSLELRKIFFIPRLFKKIYCNYYTLYLLKTWMFNEYS